MRTPPAPVPDADERPAPLVQTTVRRLLQDIMAGVYGPGHRIREEEVAERLGISRAPVREALRMLEQDGLIELAPWRGARVVKLDAAALADVFDLLGSTYGVVARLVVRHATDDDLKQISSIVDHMARQIATPDNFLKQIDRAYEFGSLMGQASRSALAERMLRRLGRVAYLSHRQLTPVPAAWLRTSRTRLEKLRDALRARDEARAEKAARKVIRHTATLLLKRVAQDNQRGQTPLNKD